MKHIDERTGKPKIILDLCGGTGSWSRPYRESGYDVRLITLPDYDVLTYEPPNNVYGILAAPPCTEFAGSGARWWADKPPHLLSEALQIVDACIRIVAYAHPTFWVLENPVGRLRRLRRDLLGEPRVIFNPCDYGDAWTKKTLIWGNFNPPAKSPVDPEFVIRGGKRFSPIHAKTGGRSARTKELRSITPPGFAQAFFRANP